MRNYEIVSTDSHLEVPPDSWRPFVDPEFQQYAPKVVKLPNGGDAWLMPGKESPVPLGLNFSAGRGFENLKVSGISYADGLVGAGDGNQRLREMDEDGIDAEILFPAVAGQRTLDTGALPTGGLRRRSRAATTTGCRRSSPRWIADRLLGLAILPATNIDDAIDELRRVSTMPGDPRRRAARVAERLGHPRSRRRRASSGSWRWSSTCRSPRT